MPATYRLSFNAIVQDAEAEIVERRICQSLQTAPRWGDDYREQAVSIIEVVLVTNKRGISLKHAIIASVSRRALARWFQRRAPSEPHLFVDLRLLSGLRQTEQDFDAPTTRSVWAGHVVALRNVRTEVFGRGGEDVAGRRRDPRPQRTVRRERRTERRETD